MWRGGSGSLTSFTAPQEGLLQSHMVYYSLPKVYCTTKGFLVLSIIGKKSGEKSRAITLIIIIPPCFIKICKFFSSRDSYSSCPEFSFFRVLPQGLLQPHKVYCNLHKVYCNLHKVYCNLHKVYCNLPKVYCNLHKVYCTLTRFNASKSFVHANKSTALSNLFLLRLF